MAENVVIVLIKGPDCVSAIMDHTLNTISLTFFTFFIQIVTSKTSPPPPTTQIVKPASTTNATAEHNATAGVLLCAFARRPLLCSFCLRPPFPPPPTTQIVTPASTTNATQPPASSAAPSLAAVSSAYVLRCSSFRCLLRCSSSRRLLLLPSTAISVALPSPLDVLRLHLLSIYSAALWLFLRSPEGGLRFRRSDLVKLGLELVVQEDGFE